MSCGDAGKKKSVYTGNQVGDLNFVGDMNYVAGGPEGSGLSAGTTIVKFIPNGTNRRPWLRQDAKFDDTLLDACWPTIGLKWFVEIELTPETTFRASDQAFYVQDKDGNNRFIDARVERAPSISVTVGEWLTPNYEVSDASMTLNNRDGYYNPWLPLGDDYRQWSSAKVTIFIGFGEKRDNYFTLFEGQITTKAGLTTTRDTVELKAYDKLDVDEVPMPPRVFSIDNFPDVDTSYSGKPVPIVYGDWTEEVPDAGSVNATCINATDLDAESYTFKVSDVELESLTEIYLHRGSRKEGEPGGPVKVDIAQVSIDLENGEFTIPVGVNVLESEISYSDNDTAGVGSGFNLVTAKDSSVNFVTRRVQEGDTVIKRNAGSVATISQVLSTQLVLTGGVTFASGDEFIINTRKYAFVKGDKLTVKCKGKKLSIISVDRLSDVSDLITTPHGLALDKDYTFWLSDDATQIIYHCDFDNTILKQIPYSQIDASITNVSSISIASDSKLWVAARVQKKVFRYDHESDALGLVVDLTSVTGLATPILELQGLAVQSNNKFWISDNGTGYFYEIDAFSSVNPFVTRTFNRSAFDGAAGETLNIAVDEENDQLLVVDRTTNKCYRVDRTTGALESSFLLTVLASNVSFVTAVSVGQDASLFFVDQGTLTIYNYNEQADASTNAAFIARDLLQKFGGHDYSEFDLSWNQTARQLDEMKCRAVVDKKGNLITTINSILAQYNVVFHIRFGRFALFWIDFSNFTTNGKSVGEKDIKEGTFKPTKELNQYFNSASATYSYRPYTGETQTSDTYVSPAAVTFAGKEVTKSINLPNVYRRDDLDKLLPLYVKLSAPEPEFVDVTFGFRLIRSQMQDFLSLNFDGDVNLRSGRKESGRRYDHVPCMIRKLSYDLGPMTVSMKLWSLGNTGFGNYIPKGNTVGGETDTVVLSNLGRLGYISPVGTITAAGGGANSLILASVSGQDAQTRTNQSIGKSWANGHKVDIVDGATKAVLQTLTVSSTSGSEVFFSEDITVSLTPTVKNAAGFITGGQFLQYSTYNSETNAQRQFYASYAKPTTNYPTTRTQELEEQRGGEHNFDDGGIPYVLYPAGYVSY